MHSSFFDTERFWCSEVTMKGVFAPQATPGYGDGTGYWNKRCAPLSPTAAREDGDDGGGRRSGDGCRYRADPAPFEWLESFIELESLIKEVAWCLRPLFVLQLGNPRGKNHGGSHWSHSEIQLNIHNPQWFKIKRYQTYKINGSIWI